MSTRLEAGAEMPSAPTRDRILQAAIDLFAAQGYAGIGVDTICKQAGVAKTGLYWNFGSKQGLLKAVIQRVGTIWIDDMKEAVVHSAGNPADRLRQSLSEIRKRIVGRPELLRVLLVILLERTDTDQETREDIRSFFARASQTFVQGIRDTWQNDLAAGDLELIGELGVAMTIGIFLLVLVDPKADVDRLLRGAGEAIARLLVPRVRGLVQTSAAPPKHAT
jgi:AcrR family transcriptional regulator